MPPKKSKAATTNSKLYKAVVAHSEKLYTPRVDAVGYVSALSRKRRVSFEDEIRSWMMVENVEIIGRQVTRRWYWTREQAIIKLLEGDAQTA